MLQLRCSSLTRINDIVLHEASSAVVREATNAVMHEATSAVVHEATSAVVHEATSAVVHEATSAVMHKTTSAVVREATNAVLHKAAKTAALLMLIFIARASAQEPAIPPEPNEATLRIKFIFNGEIPPRKLLDGSGDPFCAGCMIPDERLIVGPNRELQNVALIWDERRNKDVPKREFAKAPQRVEIEFKNCRLKPHITIARAGQVVVVRNRDNTEHSANFSFLNNSPAGLLVPVGGPQTVKLTTSEPAPIPIECNIHPWERAFLIVKEHPFVGVSNAEGIIEIQGLPVGNQWLQIWHESSNKNFQTVTWNGNQIPLTKGRIELKLAPGLNELGVMQLDAEQFLISPN